MPKDDKQVMGSVVGVTYQDEFRVGGRWRVDLAKQMEPGESARIWVIEELGASGIIGDEVAKLVSGGESRLVTRRALYDRYRPACTRCTAPMPHFHTGRVVLLAPAEWGGVKSKLGEPERKMSGCDRFGGPHAGPHPEYPGYCRSCGWPLKPLSPFRFTLQVEAVTDEEKQAETLSPLHAPVVQAERHGAAFRGARVSYGLGLQEVADAWKVSPVLLGELERGLLRFKAPADLSAALSQLWCWAVEKNPEIAR